MENYAHTPREGLFIIKCLLAGVRNGGLAMQLRTDIEQAIEDGLRPTDPATFQLTDQLADRLAESHSLLIEVRDSGIMDADLMAESPGGLDRGRAIEARFHEVLALPPDLEAMVERRIGHG